MPGGDRFAGVEGAVGEQARLVPERKNPAYEPGLAHGYGDGGHVRLREEVEHFDVVREAAGRAHDLDHVGALRGESAVQGRKVAGHCLKVVARHDEARVLPIWNQVDGVVLDVDVFGAHFYGLKEGRRSLAFAAYGTATFALGAVRHHHGARAAVEQGVEVVGVQHVEAQLCDVGGARGLPQGSGSGGRPTRPDGYPDHWRSPFVSSSFSANSPKSDTQRSGL